MGQEHVLVATGMGMSALVAAMFVVNWTNGVEPISLEMAGVTLEDQDPWDGLQRTAVPFPEPAAAKTPAPEALATPLVEIGETLAAPGGGGTPIEPDVGEASDAPVLALGPLGRWLLGDSVDDEAAASDVAELSGGDHGGQTLAAPKLLGVHGVRDGVDALLAGKADAALLLGPLAVPELDAGLMAFPLVDHVLAPATHPRIPVGSIDSAVLRQVVAGHVHHWSWLGANSGPIDLLAPKAEPQRELVQRMLLGGQPFPAGVGQLPVGHGAIHTLASRPGCIGFVSLKEMAGEDRVHLLRVDQRTASVHAYRAGAWPLGVTLHLVTVGTPRGAAADIYDWFQEQATQQHLAQRGFVHH